MKVDLRTIADGPRSFEFVLEKDWWCSGGQNDHILALDAPLRVKTTIYKAGDRYVLDGEFSGGLELGCDRCLEPYHRELKSAFKVFLALPLPDKDETEVELMEADLEVDFIRGEEVDLAEIVREQVYLSLPIKSVCSESCLGLCPVCGASLNKENCRCHREYGHHAFSKLRDLKIQGEKK